MAKNNKNIEVAIGSVFEALPNAMFRVKLDEAGSKGGEGEVLAFLSGKMRLHRIRVLVGDKVELEIDPYGGKSRIVRRFQ